MKPVPVYPTNIFGVSLTNPTGDIGEFALDYFYSGHIVNGVPFTGNAVTVGSGKMYPNPKEALYVVPDNTLLLISPAIYNYGGGDDDFSTISNKRIYMKGLGAAPVNTYLYSYSWRVDRLVLCKNNSQVIIENCKIHNEAGGKYALSVNSGSNVIVNKSILCGNGLAPGGICLEASKTTPSTVLLQNSDMYRADTVTIHNSNLASISLHKVYVDRPLTTGSCINSLAEADYVTTPTADYGISYGSNLIQENVVTRTLSWGGGEAVSIPTDGTYTLTDTEGNTIDVIVDVSEMPIVSCSDLIKIVDRFFWVGNSGHADDEAHWAVTSGGEGGAGVPTADEYAIIDNHSFSESGHHIKF